MNLRVTRRRFISLVAEGAITLGVLRVASLIPNSRHSPPLRPPGAVEEGAFVGLCVRCGICLEVCPTKAIVLAGFDKGVEAVSTPIIDPAHGYCEFLRGRCAESMLCSERCPTGALGRVDKEEVKIGTVRLNPDRCLAYMGKECLVCDEVCPVQDAITVTEDLKPVFHDDECAGCGTCVYNCPASPKALELRPEGARRVKWTG